MAQSVMPHPDTGHPAPHRDRVGAVSLGFGVLAAPSAWTLQLVIGQILASRNCAPGASGGAVWGWLLALNLIGIAIGIVGFVVAYANWRKTHTEQEGGRKSMIDAGTGRTRFIAMCGVLTSGGFVIAGVFTLALIVILRGVC